MISEIPKRLEFNVYGVKDVVFFSSFFLSFPKKIFEGFSRENLLLEEGIEKIPEKKVIRILWSKYD